MPTNFVSGGGGDFGGGGAGGSWDMSGNSDAGGGRSSSAFAAMDPRRLDLMQKVPEGAERATLPPTQSSATAANGSQLTDDMRVRIRVPPSYLTGLTSGFDGELASNFGGIIFPYVPAISYELKADYRPQEPTHSNFSINFFQKSSIGSISINGKFTVENNADAQNYFSTVHLLRALTRMRFGLDSDAGAPPPVCRLDAYGDMMLKNVPVAISSFRVELPDDVDYFTMPAIAGFGTSAAPTRSTISITCVPMYSRNEMQGFSVTGYLNSRDSRGFV